MRIHQVAPKIWHTYSKNWVNRDWMIRFFGDFWSFLSRIYIVKSAILIILVFLLIFLHEISLWAIDIDNIGCLEPFLPLWEHSSRLRQIYPWKGLFCYPLWHFEILCTGCPKKIAFRMLLEPRCIRSITNSWHPSFSIGRACVWKLFLFVVSYQDSSGSSAPKSCP